MIIAEFAQGHLGSMDTLMEMIDKAANAGASFCKIQSFFADDLSDEWKYDYDRLKSLELSWEQQKKFVEAVKFRGMTPMTSVYSEKYIPQLYECGFEYIKIGSAQCLNDLMIKTFISVGFKCIMSTGGHNLKDIPKFGPVAGVLHCVSEYPTDPRRANLLRMLDIKKYWPNTSYGFSSHIDPERAQYPLRLASYLGASFIEVHFTVLDKDKTKDGPVSLDFKQLREICQFDRLSKEEKISMYPEFGMLSCEQKDFDLIKRYEKRWKE